MRQLQAVFLVIRCRTVAARSWNSNGGLPAPRRDNLLKIRQVRVARKGEKALGIEMLERLIAGPHGARPGQAGDKHPDCHEGIRWHAGRSRTAGIRPRRPIRGMIPGCRKARVGFRIAHFKLEIPRREHDAGKVGAISVQALAGSHPGILCARFKQGRAFK